MTNNINVNSDIASLWNKVSTATNTVTGSKEESVQLYTGNDSLVPDDKQNEGFERNLLIVMEIFRSFLETLDDGIQANIAHKIFTKLIAGLPDNRGFYEDEDGNLRRDTVITGSAAIDLSGVRPTNATASDTGNTASFSTGFFITLYNDRLNLTNGQARGEITLPTSVPDNAAVTTRLNGSTSGFDRDDLKDNGGNVLLIASIDNNILTIKTTNIAKGSIVVIENPGTTTIISGADEGTYQRPFAEGLNIPVGTYIPEGIAEKMTDIHVQALKNYIGYKYDSFLKD